MKPLLLAIRLILDINIYSAVSKNIRPTYRAAKKISHYRQLSLSRIKNRKPC